MKKIFHTIYSHETVVHKDFGQSMTDQQYLDECDINSVIKRYLKTGTAPALRVGVSGDFSSIGDFQSCLERINRAKAEFDALPSDLRSRFGNDPTSYVDFVLNPANRDECVRLGLRVNPVKEDTPLDALHRIEEGIKKSKVTAPSDGAV